MRAKLDFFDLKMRHSSVGWSVESRERFNDLLTDAFFMDDLEKIQHEKNFMIGRLGNLNGFELRADQLRLGYENLTKKSELKNLKSSVLPN